MTSGHTRDGAASHRAHPTTIASALAAPTGAVCGAPTEAGRTAVRDQLAAHLTQRDPCFET